MLNERLNGHKATFTGAKTLLNFCGMSKKKQQDQVYTSNTLNVVLDSSEFICSKTRSKCIFITHLG